MKFDFKEEVRNDYLIDVKHKHIWYIEIKLLEEIIRICEKYNLSYFVYGGTLLGAVRHRGFIPWDDDVDVAMLHKDYEIFIEKAQEELDKDKYCLQRSEQFGDIYEGFARLRDNHSTAIIKKDCNRKCHHGIFVDIYPLDNVCDDLRKRKTQFLKIKIMSSLIFYRVNQDNNLRRHFIQRILKYVKNIKIWEWLVQKSKQECMRYNDTECETVGILSCDPFDEKCYWYRKDIENTIEMSFENIMVKVPKGYDRCLRIGYGEYMEFPPLEERGKWHENVFFDPFVPFGEYQGREDLFAK